MGIRKVCELLELYDDEGLRLRSYRKRACYFAFQLSLVLKDKDGINWWVRRAWEHSVMAHGRKHPQTLRLLGYVRDPSSHPASDTMNPIIGVSVALVGFATLYFTMKFTTSMLPGSWHEAFGYFS